MAHRRKKIEKERGTRTCGKGGMRKRRGKGNRGGRGYAGSKKHRKSYILQFEPDHLGKRGFVPKSHKSMKVVRFVNLDELDKLAGDKAEIDAGELGFDKILGKGKLTKKLTVKAAAFSRHAKEKIEQAGGKAVEG